MTKKRLAIANFRVYSDEQLHNNSLVRQEASVKKAADELGVEIIRTWSGAVSSKKGKNIFREDLLEMLAECKRNPQIAYAIFDELDRFMRSMLEIGYFIVEFQKLGVKVLFASQPDLKTETAMDTLVVMLEAFKAEGSNEERQRKSIAGQVKALEEGRWPFPPKPGYKKGSQRTIPDIHPVRGPILKETFLTILSEQVTPTDALIAFNRSDFTKDHSPYKMDKFRAIICDPFYAGIVEMDKQVKFRNENGLHEPLITIQQHNALVKIMSKKKKSQVGPRKNGNPIYPLSNLVTCDECRDNKNGRVVGVSIKNKATSTKVYEKYRCRVCRRHIKRDELHREIQKQFEKYTITDDGLKDLFKALGVIWKQREAAAAQEIIRLQQKIRILNKDIDRQVESATDPSNHDIKSDILRLIADKKQEVAELRTKVEKIEEDAVAYEEDFMKFAFDFVMNMGENFLLISPQNLKKCKQLIFPAGFYWTKENKVYTPEISPLIRLVTNKKDTEVSSYSQMVRVQGLKPWASSLARKRSIN